MEGEGYIQHRCLLYPNIESVNDETSKIFFIPF